MRRLDEIIKVCASNHHAHSNRMFSGSGFRFNFGEAAESSLVDDPTEHAIQVDPGFVTLPEVLAVDDDALIETGFGSLMRVKVDTDEVSDLSAGVYEGGRKVWECTYDLLQHLENLDVTGKVVLELGCGHALPAIMCSSRGAKKIVCQDYNQSVLADTTAINIQANTCGDSAMVYGDWADLRLRNMLLQACGGKADIVLSSETIYSESNLLHLYETIEAVAGSHVIIAAKRFYFGVGGGTEAFVKIVKSRGTFGITDRFVFQDGSSNMRELVVLDRI